MSDSEPFATRLTPEEAQRITDAIEVTGDTKSDFVARSIRYYILENPDNIPALQPEGQEIAEDQSDSPDRGPLEELGILPPGVGNGSSGVTDE